MNQPGPASEDDGAPIPRDMPDQQASPDGDSWDLGQDAAQAVTNTDHKVPDRDEPGAGRRGEPHSASVHPEQPVPDESSG